MGTLAVGVNPYRCRVVCCQLIVMIFMRLFALLKKLRPLWHVGDGAAGLDSHAAE